MLVRTQAPHFKTLSLSKGTDDRPGHPRTSRMLVRTIFYSIRLYFHHTPNPFA
jgi:hypothetical protein